MSSPALWNKSKLSSSFYRWLVKLILLVATAMFSFRSMLISDNPNNFMTFASTIDGGVINSKSALKVPELTSSPSEGPLKNNNVTRKSRTSENDTNLSSSLSLHHEALSKEKEEESAIRMQKTISNQIKFVQQQQRLKSQTNNFTTNSTTKASTTDNIVMLGAGIGTTGTHLFFKATCYLGFESIHWQKGCLQLGDNDAAAKKNITTGIIRRPFQIHNKLMKEYIKLSRCLRDPKKQKCRDALLWKQNILDIIDELVQNSSSSSSIQAFHDAPYPYFVNAFLESAIQHNKTFVLLLSERSPTEWLQRRIQTKHIGSDVMCRNKFFFDDDGDDSASSSNTTRITNIDTTTNGFDILGCISGYHSNSTLDDKEQESSVDLKDILVALKSVNITKNKDIIIQQVRQYQDLIRQKSNFSFNLFEQKSKTPVKSLAEMITNEIQLLQHRHLQPATHVNTWKATIEDTEEF